jgi:hypothetical protein
MTPLFLLSLEGFWLVPAIGGSACAVAFLVGWRLLAGRSDPGPAAAECPLDDSFLKGVTQERRAMPRRKGNTVEVELRDGDGQVFGGWVHDRSGGGLCLLVEQAVAEESTLELRPRAKGSTMGWVEVTVRSCRHDGKQYEVGCQFVKMPSWNELLQFG